MYIGKMTFVMHVFTVIFWQILLVTCDITHST